MMSKKPADLSASLVAVKGQATAAVEATSSSKSSAPLNFKVDLEFRRRFRQRAAEADLKLNELLREALDAWEQARGLK
jgi:hypothetical protein